MDPSKSVDGRAFESWRGSWLAYLIGRLDLYLRVRQGVIEFSRSPECLFRIQFIRSAENLVLSDGSSLRRGDRVIDLHLWNEHVPLIGGAGPTWSFARQVDKRLSASLSELARYLREHRDLDDINALRGNLVFGTKERCAHIARVAARYGFEHIRPAPALSLGARLHRFGENILISMLVLARNPRSLRASVLRRDRTLTYLSRRTLEERYGASAGQRASVGRRRRNQAGGLKEPGTP